MNYKDIIKNRELRLRILNMCAWIPDKIMLPILFRLSMNQKLDLKHPVTFNQKLQWLKLNDRKPIYTQLVDKYRVRKYIEEKIGEEYLIPLLGVWDRYEDIDFNILPDQFVLKCNHDSGSVKIVLDKNNINHIEFKEFFAKRLKNNPYRYGREWPYKHVKPQIICEKYMENNGKSPEDYKVLCFNGEPKFIEVHLNRFSDEHSQDFYDSEWNKTTISQDHSMSDIEIDKPILFDEMMRLSRLLSKDIRHVRIDWYIVDNHVYFGEITFYDGSGFESFDNPADDKMLGDLIRID